MNYLLNSAVITSPGTYEYKLITQQEATEWLKTHDYESTIGYQETADIFKILFGISINVNKISVKMKTNDEALVFRLTSRFQPNEKGHLGVDWILLHSEIGILKRTK